MTAYLQAASPCVFLMSLLANSNKQVSHCCTSLNPPECLLHVRFHPFDVLVELAEVYGVVMIAVKVLKYVMEVFL